MKKIMAAGGMLLGLFIAITWSQNYPAATRVPVIVYDYHSNQSNPEFETIPPGSNAGVWKGMASETLDVQRKPVLGAHPFFNLAIAKWFRPWTAGDFTIPNYGIASPEYALANAAGLSPAFITVNYDTAFKNIVFRDTLIFTYVPGSAGTYQFDDQNFFPLDGKGFGAEVKTHNFSFTMELHWNFTMEPGLNFQFTGDDDIWVFIDNKLVLDAGGRHNPSSGAVDLDTLGLVNGQSYWMDFFYCERHTTSATINIRSNLFKVRSDSIKISKAPARDTISAGDSIVFSADINDVNGAPCSLCNQNVKWTMAPSTDSTRMAPGTGRQCTLYAMTAYRSYIITARYDNPENTIHLEMLDTLYVRPGAPDHLVIEANSDSMVSLRNDAPIRPGAIVFSPEILKDSVYAVMRDYFGNWVGPAVLASWLSGDSTIVTASSGRAQLGEGVLTRQTANRDTVLIIAAQGALKDSLHVVIGDVTYSRIQMFVISEGKKVVDTLRMRIGQDTTLYAFGLRGDGSGVWDDLSVSWGTSSGMILDSAAPLPGKRWMIRPNEPGTGFIHISFTSQSRILGDTLYAFFAPSEKRNFSAWANDNIFKDTAIDNDDYVLLTFDNPIDIFSVTANVIDSLLPLSNGHSWLSGSGSIGKVQWSSDNTKLLITLSTQAGVPTIRVGDTISCPSVRNKTVLTGSFGPSLIIGAMAQTTGPARLISVAQNDRSEVGLVFTFSSSAIQRIRIRIVDMFGRLMYDGDVRNMHQCNSHCFVLRDKDYGAKNRMAKGTYCAQVFRRDVLTQTIVFLKK
jgi:fibro-slime domain-containing protein